jgi:multidrug efflux pump subunit AcrA (membrane-fusion protein)
MRGAKLTWERYIEDENAKLHAIGVAKQELLQAQVILTLYEIRSPVSGVIGAILKKEGEAVKELEGVFRIRTK